MTRLSALALLIALAGCGGAPTPPAARWAVLASPDVPLEGARRLTPDPAPPAPLARASERLEEARRHAMRFEPSDALTAVSEAQEILERHVRTDEARRQLHQALALRGLLESNLEHPLAAREALERAARLDPDASLDEALFPPDMLATYGELVREIRGEPPASLAITSEPGEATARFDGRVVGRTPASVHARAGAHFVDVEALGYERRLLPVRLSVEGNAPLVVRLPPASPGRVGAQLEALDLDALATLGAASRRALRERLDADVLLRVHGGEVLALDLRGDAAVRGPAAGRPLASWVDELFYREPDAGEQALGSGWLWLAVGLVVAGATAAVLGATLYEPPGVIRAGPPMD